MNPIDVVVVDDHALVRAGYARLLALEPDLNVAAEFGDADAAYDWVCRRGGAPSVMLLDLSMPGRSGFDLIRRLTLRWPAVRVLVCTMHDSPALLARALAAGACGFLTKRCDPAELAPSIRRVAGGGRVVSGDLDAAVADGATARGPALSARELEVLWRLGHGESVESIADAMRLAAKTVANLQSSVRRKLGAAHAVDLLRRAREYGLLGD
jgi:DNA-binding NarL/FixJ family response regulator